MSHLKSYITGAIHTYLESSMPATEHNGRYAVINGPVKIKRIGGSKVKDKYMLDGKEVGHEHKGRDYFDPELMKKHGINRLTNAWMD